MDIRTSELKLFHQMMNEYMQREKLELKKLTSNYYENQLEQILTEMPAEKKNEALIYYRQNLIETYSSICFSNETNIIKECLTKIGFSQKNTNWIIPYDEIANCIKQINKDNIFDVFINGIFYTINFYLNLKIAKEVYDTIDIYDRHNKTMLNSKGIIVGLDNIQKKAEYRKSSKRNIKKSEFDVKWEKLKADLLQSGATKEYIDNFEAKNRSLLTRKADSILVDIYKYFHAKPNANITESSKLLALYPLFQLIMPHRNWPNSELAFMSQTKVGSGMNYREYKIWTMRRFIFKK